MSAFTCTRCERPIIPGERWERYDATRKVHSRCVGELIKEILTMMADLPESVRDADDE